MQQTTIAQTMLQRGPYGEILPPPLVSGLSEDEALNILVSASRRLGKEITSIPTRGQSRRGLINVAMLYVHQSNLASAIAGQLSGNPDAMALHQAVVENRLPMSLRPLGMENLWFSSFVPVLQLVNPGKALWQVGVPSRGRHTTFRAKTDIAVRRAQQLYVEWSERDREQFQTLLGQAVKSIKPYYQHIVWLATLTTSPDSTTRPAFGYALQRLGKHSTYRIVTPEGERVLETSRPVRAVQMVSAILARRKVKMPHYLPGQVVGALVRMGSVPPVSDGDVWRMGEYKAKFVNRQVIGISRGKNRYGLTRQGNIFQVGKVTGTNKASKVLSSLVIPEVWTQEERIRVGLTWAMWVIGGAR